MAEASRSRARTLSPILAVNFVGSLGFSLVLPFLVFLVTRLGGNALVYGVLGATYSAFQLVGAPVLGRWSDRFGRKRILLLSHLGTLVSWGIFLVALHIPVRRLLAVDAPVAGAFTLTVPLVLLFLARALDGVTGGNVSVANAYLADVTDEADRSAVFGKMSVASNLGFVVGPALAGLLGATAWGETLPVLAAFAISAVASLLIFFLLPAAEPCVLAADPEPANVRKAFGQESKDCFQLSTATRLSVHQILALPGVALLLALHFLVFLAFNLFYIAFPVFAAEGLGWSITRLGVFFSVMSVAMALVQGPVLERAAKVWSDRWLVVGGALVLAASFVAFVSRSTAVIYAGTLLLALGNGLMWPSLLSLLSKAAGRRFQGAVQGFAGSAAAVASIVGLLTGGLLYGAIGPWVFVVSAVITSLVVLLALRIRQPRADRS